MQEEMIKKEIVSEATIKQKEEIKILVGTPICESKKYSWTEYVEAVKNLKVPKGILGRVLLVDTSDKKNALRIDVEDAAFLYEHVKAWKAMDKVVAGRNKVFEYALKNNYDYVFFIDSDVMVPPDALKKLLEAKKDIIGGFYPITTALGLPTPSAKVYNLETKNYEDFPSDLLDSKIHEADLLGMGCCLITKKVFGNYKFRCERGEYGMLLRSEDVCFCDDLRRGGVKLWFDTDLTCKHKIIGDHWNPQEA